MSDKIVRRHQNISNRARIRDPTDNKTVYKSVLENPFRVQWPRIPVNLQNMLLARVLNMLQGVSDFQHARRQQNCKRKKTRNGPNERKNKNPRLITEEDGPEDSLGSAMEEAPVLSTDAAMSTAGDHDTSESHTAAPTGDNLPPAPFHFTIGINEVTKRLEETAKAFRQSITPGMTPGHANVPDLLPPLTDQLVLVCQADVDPPILISHLPQLVASCNSSRPTLTNIPPPTLTWLIPLPLGAETALAEALGVRRASVLMINNTTPKFSTIKDLLESVPVLSAPWLNSCPMDHVMGLVPTHIKQLRTTAPRNMKAVKEKRSKGRAAAKERRNLLRAKLKGSNEEMTTTEK